MNQLFKIYKKFSAPEGSGDKGTAHSYIEHYYQQRFDKIRLNKMNILEIGVSTGLSLEMWCEYFPNSNIIGVELDNIKYKPSNNRIKLIIGNRTDSKTFENIDNLDIIIDDGGHTSNQQISSFNFLFEELKLGGVYLVEDTHTSYAKDFQDRDDQLTFIEYAKVLSDELNDWYRIKDYKLYKQKIDYVDVSYWAKFIYKVCFYNSIVSIEKRQSETPLSELS